MIEKDLAEGTFLNKWPIWLRWLLFIPSAIIIPLFFYLFQYLMQTWFLGVGPDAFYLVLSRGVIYGGGFVIVGSMVAPRVQKIVSLVLMIFMAMFVGVGIYSTILVEGPISHVIEGLIMLASAGYATYYVFNESNKES